MQSGKSRRSVYRRPTNLVFSASLATAIFYGVAAKADQLVSNDQYSLSWDNTFRYTTGVRVAGQNSEMINRLGLAGSPNGPSGLGPAGIGSGADGDQSFNKGGFIANRLDWLTGLNLDLKDSHLLGLRLSAEGYYDTIYNSSHNSLPTGLDNEISVAPNEFNRTARREMGRDLMLDDAFVHGRFEIGDDHPVDFRVGRYTLIWGESLFLATNGIAFGQGPINVIKATSNPQIEAKEVFLPVSQVSATMRLGGGFTLQGYYQVEFRQSRLPPPGSYFNSNDFYGDGAETLLVNQGSQPLGPFGPPLPIACGILRGNVVGGSCVTSTPHVKNVDGPEWHGNFGVALKYSDTDTGWDYGLYALTFTDKLPQTLGTFVGLGTPAAHPVSYYFYYPRNIQLYGVSASTNFGPFNVAGELSARHNMPLLTAQLVPDARSVPLGDTLHAQMSLIYLVPPSRFWDSAPLAAEIGGQHSLSINQGARYFDTSRSHTAAGTTFVFTPTYYQVVPGLDLGVPIGVSYNLSGLSPIDHGFNGGGARHGGDISLGMSGIYQNVWRGSLTYVRYVGGPADNTLSDRDFVQFSVERSF